MQTPVEIEFQEMAASPEVQELIEDHVKKLKQRYPILNMWFFRPSRRGALVERDMSSCFCCSAM